MFTNKQIFSLQQIEVLLNAHLLPGCLVDSEVTFSSLELSCHLFVKPSNYSKVECISLSALPKDTQENLPA